jgi:hypothetical protein
VGRDGLAVGHWPKGSEAKRHRWRLVVLGKELFGICNVLGRRRRERSNGLWGNGILLQGFQCRRCRGVEFRPSLGTTVNESPLDLFKVLNEILAALYTELQVLLVLLLSFRFLLQVLLFLFFNL